MKANMHWLVMQDRGHKQMTKHERMTKRRCFACPFVILPLPAGKFPLQPVDKTRHGREETAARFRRDRWRWFFGVAFDRPFAGGRSSRHRDRQFGRGEHGEHWARQEDLLASAISPLQIMLLCKAWIVRQPQ